MHVGTYTIDANDDHSNDGDYVFQVEYKDRSNNEMTSYTSGVKVIDTTKPVINVEYSNSNVINELTDTENHTRKYFASAQTATITITRIEEEITRKQNRIRTLGNSIDNCNNTISNMNATIRRIEAQEREEARRRAEERRRAESASNN